MMPCEPVGFPGGTAIVCTRKRRRKPRCACGNAETRLCDQPITLGPVGTTCDRSLCARCAVRIGPDRDLCPEHAASAHGALASVKQEDHL